MSQTCREAVLEAFDRLEGRHQSKVFRVPEIAREIFTVTDEFKESTIATHIVSRMCFQAPRNHGTTYDDLDRVGAGQYSKRNN